MVPFRVGIVGIGGMGLLHHQALQKLAIPVVSVMSRQKEKGFAVARQWGVKYCQTIDELVESGIDVAVVATPTESHAEILQGLLEKGVRMIFCEKPLVRTMEEAQRVAELWRQKGAYIGVGYKMRFETAFRIAREKVENGTIGKLQSVTFNYFQTTPSQPWYLESGVIHEILSHVIDLSNWFSGTPVEVVCQIQNFQGGTGEDRAYLVVRYQNEIMATVQGGWIKGYPERPGKQLRNICFQLVGERGYITGVRGWKIFLCNDVQEETVQIEPVDAVVEELRAFFEAIEKNQPPPVGLKEGITAQAVIEAALKSAVNGVKESISAVAW